jgi:uncharacterized protein YecE (DUF72 family)
MNYYSGLSGLQIPVPRYMYPEEFQNTSRLRYYSTLFNSIEINSSFYKVPRAKTIEKWTTETGGDFKFTFKVWQQITHNKNLAFNEVDVYTFLEAVASAGVKKGCLLIQLPPSNGIENFPQLGELFAIFKGHNLSGEWDLAIEFRNSSWYSEKVYELSERFNFTIVIHDMKKSKTPMIESNLKVKYVRFHGPDSAYRGTYTEDFLSEYATYIHGWIVEGKKVYAYFNNTIGDAYGNLIMLNKKLVELQRV